MISLKIDGNLWVVCYMVMTDLHISCLDILPLKDISFNILSTRSGNIFRISAASQSPVLGTLRDAKGNLRDLKGIH